MKKRGYKSAVHTPEVEKVILEVNAYSDFIPELIEKINKAIGLRQVTKAELKRDFRFTDSALRLLEKNKLLVPTLVADKRPTYDLAKALKIRVLFAGHTIAKNLRMKKKRANITSISKDWFNKVTGPQNGV